MQRNDDKPKKPAPHEVLGVAIDASEDVIKKAYKKLALALHPDRNRGNETEAKIKFQELNEANAIMMDREKRKAHYAKKEVPKYMKDIISAIVENNPAKVETLLKQAAANQKDFNINNIVDDRGALIHIAASEGKPKAMAVLIEMGADINKPDEHGQTPLHLAVKRELKDWIKTSRVLLKQLDDIDVNAKDKDGNTPLHLCADRGYLLLAQEIMSNEPDTTIKNNAGLTAEQIAASGKRPKDSEIAELIRNGLPEEDQGFFASILDDVKGVFGIGEKKPEGKSPPAPDKENTSKANAAPAEAKPHSSTESVQSKLQDKQPLCVKLHLAIKAGDLETTQLMITQGAEVNQLLNGESALHVAARSEKYSKDMIDLLIQNKADFNQSDKNGSTLLHIAAEYNDRELISQLLGDNRTRVNAQDKNGDTALHIAILTGNNDIADMLVDCKRVNTEIKNKAQLSPVEMFDLMQVELPQRTKTAPHAVNESITSKKPGVEPVAEHKQTPMKVGGK